MYEYEYGISWSMFPCENMTKTQKKKQKKQSKWKYSKDSAARIQSNKKVGKKSFVHDSTLYLVR